MIGSILVFVFRELQECKQFVGLIETLRKYYPSSRPFRIGLDSQGRVPRITWVEAKRMLREELAITLTSDNEDLTCVFYDSRCSCFPTLFNNMTLVLGLKEKMPLDRQTCLPSSNSRYVCVNSTQ
jgi:hypothetical protein